MVELPGCVELASGPLRRLGEAVRGPLAEYVNVDSIDPAPLSVPTSRRIAPPVPPPPSEVLTFPPLPPVARIAPSTISVAAVIRIRPPP